MHNDDDDAGVTPKGRPDFVALGLKILQFLIAKTFFCTGEPTIGVNADPVGEVHGCESLRPGEGRPEYLRGRVAPGRGTLQCERHTQVWVVRPHR